MPKQCSEPNCDGNVFAKNLCLYHQYKRKLGTKKKREGKYTRIKRKSLKKALNEDIISFGFKDQVELFNHIWETQSHVCWLTKRPLPEKDIRMFAHVLRKRKYTYFKLNPDNIRLLLPTIHDLVDNFKEEYREQLPHIDFDSWFNLQDEMKIKYEEFKSKNLLA
jgi:hypothetical protein